VRGNKIEASNKETLKVNVQTIGKPKAKEFLIG
jgi:hypothetical protein